MTPTPVLPSSGQLLGKLLRALRLRQQMEEVVPKRTLIRICNGDPSVKPETRQDAFRAMVDAVLSDALLQAWGLRPENHEPFRRLMADRVDGAVVGWDLASSQLLSHGPPISSPAYAWLPWVRLFALGMALRVAAYGVARAQPGLSEEGARQLISGDAFAHVLRQYRTQGNLTRTDISTGGGVAQSTVDEWFSGRALPQSESILNLASLFASRIDALHEAEAELILRVSVAASELVRWLRRVCTLDATRAPAFVLQFTTATKALRFLIESTIQAQGAVVDLWGIVLQGSVAYDSKILLGALLERTRDSYLRTDIEALLSAQWGARVLMMYRQLPNPTNPTNRAREEAQLRRHGLAPPPPSMWATVSEMSAWGVLTPNPNGWRFPAFPDVDFSSLLGHTDLQAVTFTADPNSGLPHQISRQAMRDHHVYDDPQAAVVKYTRLAAQEPRDAKYRFWLGAALASAGEPDRGIVECRIACTLDPSWSLPATEVAVILFNAGRVADALEAIQRAVRAHRVDAHMAHTHGRILLRLERYADAIPWFRRTLREKDRHPEATACLAHCLLLTKQRKAGCKCAKRAHHLGIRGVLERLKAGHYPR